MFVRRADELAGRAMEMDGADGVTMRIMVGRDDGAPNFAMRHFTVIPGGHTPRHKHDYEHEVVVVEGAGRVESDGRHREVRPGDVVYIPPNTLRQFVNESEAPFKFLCLVPVTFDCGKPTPGT